MGDFRIEVRLPQQFGMKLIVEASHFDRQIGKFSKVFVEIKDIG